jgi:hypothetical protein
MTSGETHGIFLGHWGFTVEVSGFLYAKEPGMADFMKPLASIPNAFFVNAGEDRFGEYRGLGISSIAFKPCYTEKPKTAGLTYFVRPTVFGL